MFRTIIIKKKMFNREMTDLAVLKEANASGQRETVIRII